MKNLLLLPIRVLSLGTGAKSFAGNPVIGSPLLNRLGLHVARLVLADRAMAFRRLLLSPTVAAGDRAAFRRDGFILKSDFLPAAEFAALEAEIRALRAPGRACHQGDTITHRILLDHHALAGLPTARRLLSDRRYRRLLGYVAGRLRVPGQWVQTIRSGVLPGPPDPQTNLHIDTFQPTMKAWLFLDDVDEASGPFTYVPGSHRLTRSRLAYEYRRSLGERDSPDRLSARGSLRVPVTDLPGLGLPAPRAFAVKRNTLVVADTRGLHRRGDVLRRPSDRMEIWAMARTNPFNPLPGLPFAWCDRLDLALYRAWLEHQDTRAAKRGGQPSWRLVPPAEGS
ncbi:phytanoyl-CoA dioxygenase family protein [Zavarzinia compransoris]|uniref:phytanoyl-CoA dioxygenase family protein n=1 Tax=Zavarzinia marina TaxID=2911065 RepID=UPI001F2C71A4|nr:phytanoyl-CoA dioxygenase family protein [Zavarzinia marina]MCF4167614.1 phytanoyl-CoA dioxygenase family protein [Zavarzinia marina]